MYRLFHDTPKSVNSGAHHAQRVAWTVAWAVDVAVKVNLDRTGKGFNDLGVGAEGERAVANVAFIHGFGPREGALPRKAKGLPGIITRCTYSTYFSKKRWRRRKSDRW